MENKKSKRIFKVVMAAMSLALVAAISYGATLALMSNTTNNKQNTFTSSESVKITLDEPAWTYGENGVNYTPDKEVAKDPTVTLDRTSANSYIAVKVEFIVNNESVSYDYFKENIANLMTNSDEGVDEEGVDSAWTIAPGTEDDTTGLVLYYTDANGLKILDQTTSSTPSVFDSIKFKGQNTLKDSKAYNEQTDTYNDVKIEVTAYAVDAQGINGGAVVETPAEGSAQAILNDLI